MNKLHSVSILERLLSTWELDRWIHELAFINPGLMALSAHKDLPDHFRKDLFELSQHWRELRGHLLDLPQTNFDFLRFMGKFAPDSRADFRMVPAWLASWVLSSKRVFTLDAELQLLLSLTGNQDIKWDMVKFPFDSFLINLAQPIICKERGLKVVSMLLTHETLFMEGLGVLGRSRTLVLIDDSNRTLSDISTPEREKISRLAHVNPTKCAAMLNKLATIRHVGAIRLPEMIDSGENIEWKLINTDPVLKECIDVFFGFVCYLNTMSRSVITEQESWKDVEKTETPPPNHKAVTSGAQVFAVHFGQKLTPEEKLALHSIGKGGFEVSAHWRRGHFRRAPGSGNDPMAPRNIWVRPTLVRRDKADSGEGILGTEQDVQ